MESQEVLDLVCNITFRTLVREGESLQAYTNQNNKKIVQEAVDLIQYLDAQKVTFTSSTIENNYQGVLNKILFNS